MYLSETLARDRYQELLRCAEEVRWVRQAVKLRKIQRMRNRAERKYLEMQRRVDEIQAELDAAS